jgi:hypothetical protein
LNVHAQIEAKLQRHLGLGNFLKLCCNIDGHSVSENRNSTVIYEGGCRNVVFLKPLLDVFERGGLGVGCLFF